ncbi:MAG: hypothetical protein QW472_04405 [Candidatus Aenigmatarchaeota archaeon]
MDIVNLKAKEFYGKKVMELAEKIFRSMEKSGKVRQILEYEGVSVSREDIYMNIVTRILQACKDYSTQLTKNGSLSVGIEYLQTALNGIDEKFIIDSLQESVTKKKATAVFTDHILNGSKEIERVIRGEKKEYIVSDRTYYRIRKHIKRLPISSRRITSSIEDTFKDKDDSNRRKPEEKIAKKDET